MISRRKFVDASAVTLLLALGQVNTINAQTCAPNGNCDIEYHTSGSDSNCQYQYDQIYCDSGVYMDCSTTSCETASSINVRVNCNC